MEAVTRAGGAAADLRLEGGVVGQGLRAGDGQDTGRIARGEEAEDHDAAVDRAGTAEGGARGDDDTGGGHVAVDGQEARLDDGSAVVARAADELQLAARRLDEVARAGDGTGVDALLDRQGLAAGDVEVAGAGDVGDGDVTQEVHHARAGAARDGAVTREGGGAGAGEAAGQGRGTRTAEVQRGVVGHLAEQGDVLGELQRARVDGGGADVVTGADAGQGQRTARGLDERTAAREGAGEAAAVDGEHLAAGDADGGGVRAVEGADGRVAREARGARTRETRGQRGVAGVGEVQRGVVRHLTGQGHGLREGQRARGDGRGALVVVRIDPGEHQRAAVGLDERARAGERAGIAAVADGEDLAVGDADRGVAGAVEGADGGITREGSRARASQARGQGRETGAGGETEGGVIGHLARQRRRGVEHQGAGIDRRGALIPVHIRAAQDEGVSGDLGDGTVTRKRTPEVIR